MRSGWLDLETTADETAAATPEAIDGAIRWGRLLIVVLLYAVSPLALMMFGWNYYDTGGSPLTKLHPSTLLTLGVLGLMAIKLRGNPVSGLLAIAERNAALIPFLFAVLFMMAYVAVILKIPVTLFIEVFLGAAVTFAVFRGLDDTEARRLALLIHALLFANAALAFYEVATGFRLTPLVINGEDLVEETRATALLGHPLANAMIAGAYIIALALGGGHALTVVPRAIAFLVALASLIPFGGRASTAATGLALALLAVRKGFRILRGEPIDPRTVVAGLLVVPIAAFGLIAAFEMGLLDTLTNRIVDDEGSAGTRLEMFELFRHLDTYDILFGPDPAKLMTWVRLHGLEYGLESFPVAFVLNYGVVPALIFFPALIWFFIELGRACRPGSALVLVYFLLVSLTSISLSAKSPLLSVFVIVLLVLMRRGGDRDALEQDEN